MTESSRQQYIQRALADHKERTNPETVRLPLRNTEIVPVIEVPLSIPILNADSFRIAPQLAEHPKRQLVAASPDSAEAQDVVAELVRSAHRKAEDLKANLLAEGGQTQPGVITRKGKLINANTRCVLLRELEREGNGPTGTLRVAVLPHGVTDQELLELEMVLQQQLELKDEYRLVSELMMIQRLYNEGFADEQIARKLRKKGKEVKEAREILTLMHRTRALPDTPLPLTAFDSEVDRRQNWAELLRDVKNLDEREGHCAGDLHIKRWLIAYFSRANSVHKLRFAEDDWVERDGVVEVLQDHMDLRSILPNSERDTSRTGKSTANETEISPPRDIAIKNQEDELGLDLLGDEEPEIDVAAAEQVDAILNLVIAANKAGDEPITLPNGESIAGTEALHTIGRGVEVALETVKRRRQAGGRLVRPLSELERARNALKSAAEALDEVGNDPGFASQWQHVSVRVQQIESLLRELMTKLSQRGAGTDTGNWESAV
ncbi:hypothetical protein [Sphaerisporangium sp. TRM90804]|uniref:hypothetical protein n=1 Tax=Sphaerisporangium sp. TRM90804 TaxID=3031113 RepID=UPI00244D6522|nr:hypothetical protein [Sphaerisporangium sp. TRM90804]MDH2429685.1 hypothetical protein [Sphaerisporangium sp. TRM90804]